MILTFSPKEGLLQGGSEITLEDDMSWINGDGVDGESGRTLQLRKCPDQKYR